MVETIQRILRIAGSYRSKITSGIVLSLFHSFFSAMDLFAVLYIAMHYQALTPQKITAALCILAVGLAGKIFCKWKITSNVSGSSYDIFYEKRMQAGQRLKKAPMGYFSERNLGEIQLAMTTDMNDLESSAMSIVENILGSFIYGTVCTLVLLVMNWKIGLITLAGLAVGIYFLHIVQKNARTAGPMRFQAQEDMTGKAIEFVQGNMVMRLFGEGENGLDRVKDAFAQKEAADITVENAAMWPVNLYRFGFRLASCGVILASALLYLNGSMSFASCVMFLFSAFLVYTQMDGLAANIAVLRIAENALTEIDTVLSLPEMPGSDGTADIRDHTITLKDVSFSYGQRPVLSHISLTIPQNSTTAIVGPSGSGKTTLCNLIARFWDADEGDILLGGKNIRTIQPEALMQNISIVFQNVYLFRDTIENNIRFGCPGASHEQVEAAAKRACCHDFIMSLPDGYNTVVGEGGSTLSGGEKQRISIARAILKDAPVVILDEATSSVDPENQKQLLQAIAALTKGKTLITIAHRLQTIRHADQIVVLDQGQIAEQGTHEQLMSHNGLYRRLVTIREDAACWKI